MKRPGDKSNVVHFRAAKQAAAQKRAASKKPQESLNDRAVGLLRAEIDDGLERVARLYPALLEQVAGYVSGLLASISIRLCREQEK